jgi:hypothetical protein
MDSYSNNISLNEEESEESFSSSSSYNPNLNYIPPNKYNNKHIDESSWSMEDEFIFFEGQYIVGNKWTFLCNLFPGKSSKQMKNHFYSSIVKTLRKVLRNRIDLNLKDSIVSYYSLLYIKDLLKNPQNFLLFSKNKDDDTQNKNVTLKKLIVNNNVNYETLNKYQSKFEILVKKQMKKLYKINTDISNLKIRLLFKIIVKSEILVKSYQILNSKNLNNDDIIKIIEFIDKNYIK